VFHVVVISSVRIVDRENSTLGLEAPSNDDKLIKAKDDSLDGFLSLSM
jgi:hypothetical protein